MKSLSNQAHGGGGLGLLRGGRQGHGNERALALGKFVVLCSRGESRGKIGGSFGAWGD